MNIIIAGGRDFNDYGLLEITVDKFIADFDVEDVTIVSGMAEGADKLGEIYAYNHNYKLVTFKADWNKHGKAAGPIRNKVMADFSDALIAFWDGKSRGTANMIQTMRNQNKLSVVVNF